MSGAGAAWRKPAAGIGTPASERGVELDFVWRPAKDLNLVGGVAFTDAQVDAFSFLDALALRLGVTAGGGTGGSSSIVQDIPPYVLCAGNPSKPHGVNTEGLKRRGFTPEVISALRESYKILYRRGLTLDEARAEMQALGSTDPQIGAAIGVTIDFLGKSTRGIVRA